MPHGHAAGPGERGRVCLPLGLRGTPRSALSPALSGGRGRRCPLAGPEHGRRTAGNQPGTGGSGSAECGSQAGAAACGVRGGGELAAGGRGSGIPGWGGIPSHPSGREPREA